MKFKDMGSVMGTTFYGAVVGKYSFVIAANEIGYSASYKDREFTGGQSSYYIEDSLRTPFMSKKEAEEACKKKLKELRKH